VSCTVGSMLVLEKFGLHGIDWLTSVVLPTSVLKMLTLWLAYKFELWNTNVFQNIYREVLATLITQPLVVQKKSASKSIAALDSNDRNLTKTRETSSQEICAHLSKTRARGATTAAGTRLR
jgi:hypothetical protein